MKRIVFLITAIFTTLLFCGCSLSGYPEMEDPDPIEKLASSRSNELKFDVEYRLGIGGRMYWDLAVSNDKSYRLHENGNVMVNNLRPSMTSAGTLYRNYDAIDFVTAGSNRWGLIGASDETNRIYIKGEINNNNYGIYPDDVDSVTEIAAIQYDRNRLKIYIVFPGSYYSYRRMVGTYDKRVTNSNTRITWDYDSETDFSMYWGGLSAMGSKLLSKFVYYTCRFLKFTPPDGDSEVEDLGTYYSHGYLGGDKVIPIGFDYCPEDKYLYILDNMGTSSQAIVRLDTTEMEWD
jgi:hypothetical protein